jgi:protein associated with RNAse G/E
MPDDLVQIDFRKWGGARHWQFVMRRLGEDEHGLWLWSPPGTAMQRGHEPVRSSRHTNVKLIPADKWWTAIWSHRGEAQLYVDVVTPARWSGNTVTMIDVDLDVVRWADGSVEVLDEDEFIEHQATLDYPPRLVDTARAVTARLALAVEAGHEPFGTVGEAWMKRAVAMGGSDD